MAATFSRGQANVRTLRDGLPPIVRPLAIPMRKPPHRINEGGDAIEGGLLAAA